MPELIAKANQAILEAQMLRRERRSLRVEAAVPASRLGETVVKARETENETTLLRTNLDQSFSRP